MITIICVGKIKEGYLNNLIEDYYKRINKYHKLTIIEVKDGDLKTETSLIVKSIKNDSFIVTLEIGGNNLTSTELAGNLDKWLMKYANVTFIIGASNGLSDEIINMSNYHLSFGKNTYPHGLFRGILLEQIYRCFKINNNETYHK